MKECDFKDVCIPCGQECKGLPCTREQVWTEQSQEKDCTSSILRQIERRQSEIDARNRANERDEQFIKQMNLLYQKLTGQLEMSFEEILERAR